MVGTRSFECRREDSNLHSLNGNQVLNLVSAYFMHIGVELAPRWKFQDIKQMRPFRAVTLYPRWLDRGNSAPPKCPPRTEPGQAILDSGLRSVSALTVFRRKRQPSKSKSRRTRSASHIFHRLGGLTSRKSVMRPLAGAATGYAAAYGPL